MFECAGSHYGQTEPSDRRYHAGRSVPCREATAEELGLNEADEKLDGPLSIHLELVPMSPISACPELWMVWRCDSVCVV